MPAIAHLGLGLAAKKVLPDIHVGILIIASEFIEIAFFLFYFAGIESMPTPTVAPFTPYSHSLFMGIVWSIIAAFFFWLFKRNTRSSIIIGLLAFSHTILDIIASPKLAFYPYDLAVPIFFDYSNTIGFGLWSNQTVAAIGEISIVVIGLIIYISTRLALSKK